MPLSSSKFDWPCSSTGSSVYCPTSPSYSPTSPVYRPASTEHCSLSRSCIPNCAPDQVPVVLNSLPVRYLTPLDCAATNGHEEVVKLVLSKRADANASGVNDLMPLCSAINEGHDQIVKLLLDHGFYVDVNDEQLRKALFSAGSLGYDRTIEHVLKSRPDVNVVVDNTGRTLLYKAILGGVVNVAELLIKAGSDLNAVGVDGKTLLLHALSRSVDAPNPSYHPLPSDTYLVRDCKTEGLEKIVKCLLEHGARVDPTDENLKDTLRLAVARGMHKVIELVLKNCPDVKTLLHANGTPVLHIAFEKNYPKVAKVLIKYGASVNTTDKRGETALHLVALANHKGVEMLLEYGADIDRRDEDGETALHIAARHNVLQVITVLPEYGANVNITSNNNFTALDHVLQRSEFRRDYKTHDPPILTKHLIKMRAANLFVSQKNLQSIDLCDSDSYLYDTCKAECEKMRKTKIAGSRLSFYDILTGFHYARNESVVRTLESLDYEAMFPMYSDWIKNNFKRAQRIMYLLNSGAPLFNSPLEYELPADLTMEIFSYLSNFDLQNLIDAYTNDNGEKLYEIYVRNKRKNNVIIKGFRVQSRNDSEREVKGFLERLARKEVKLENVRELQDEGRTTYLVRFEECASKILVMRRKRTLKRRNIFIGNDLTKRQRDIQKSLIIRARDATRYKERK